MISCKNISVLNFNLMLPKNGVWQTGSLVLNTGDETQFKTGDRVSIVDDGGLTFNGTILPGRVGLSVDTLHLRVIGGANGMDIHPAPKQFNAAFLRDIINHLMTSSGETLSNTVDQGLLSKYIGNWTVFAGTVAIALNQILGFIDFNLNWRILPDGKLWFGYDKYPAVKDVNALITKPPNPTEKMITLGLANLTIECGVTLSNASQVIGKVARIQYDVTQGAIKAVVWNDIESISGRGNLPAIEDQIATLTDRFRFLGCYLGKVVAQSSDWKTVDIQSTDANVPDMSKVPLLTGQYWNIVGENVKYGWFGGLPSQPWAEPYINANNPTFVALANKVDNNHNAIQNGLNTHIHLAGTFTTATGGPVTGVSGAATPDGYYTPTSTAASKVKAE